MPIETVKQVCLGAMHQLNIDYKTDIEARRRLYNELNHARDVLRWIYKLSPTEPSYELQIAGLFHDSDRWINVKSPIGFKGDRSSQDYEQYKKEHALRSADYADVECSHVGISVEFRNRIRFLIEHHDDTGVEVESINDPELNILVAADSFSFFTSIVPDMLKREGMDRVKDKIRFMIGKMPQSMRQLLFHQIIDIKEIDTVKNEILSEYLTI